MPDRVNLLATPGRWCRRIAHRFRLSRPHRKIDRVRSSWPNASNCRTLSISSIGCFARNPLRPAIPKIMRAGFCARASIEVGWEPRPNESCVNRHLLRSLTHSRARAARMIQEIVAGCRERFAKFLSDPQALAPDLRPPVFTVVGHYADEKTWEKLHELGMKTTSIEEKQNYYRRARRQTRSELLDARSHLSLTDELPTSRALPRCVPFVRARWRPSGSGVGFCASAHETLLAKADALAINQLRRRFI